MRSKLRTVLTALGIVAVAALCATGGSGTARVSAATKPNIWYVWTDDSNTDTLYKAMPNVVHQIGDQGTTFPNAFYAQPQCCPSRASMARGQYPHNTGVLANKGPHGGFDAFLKRGEQKDTYARTVNAGGYRTAYIGKYMNGYRKHLNVVPTGWDTWFAGEPMGKCFSDNGHKSCPASFRHRLFDSWVAQKASSWLDSVKRGGKPWFLVTSFHNPHGPCQYPDSYNSLFRNATNEDKPSFNEADVSDKPAWVRKKPRFGAARVSKINQLYRCRLRAASYTDHLIGGLLDKLKASKELDNTVIVFWNDNGFTVGEHRLVSKDAPYIEDERFPLMVRGPGVPAGASRPEPISGVDLRPTFEEIAGVSRLTPNYVDGVSWWPLAQGKRPTAWRTYAYAEQLNKSGHLWKATYTANGAYHRWTATDEEEFYDLRSDPFELDGTISSEESKVIDGYRKALSEYKGCKGASCRRAGMGP